MFLTVELLQVDCLAPASLSSFLSLLLCFLLVFIAFLVGWRAVVDFWILIVCLAFCFEGPACELVLLEFNHL